VSQSLTDNLLRILKEVKGSGSKGRGFKKSEKVKAAMKLVEMGLLRTKETKRGVKYFLTEEGRALLEKEEISKRRAPRRAALQPSIVKEIVAIREELLRAINEGFESIRRELGRLNYRTPQYSIYSFLESLQKAYLIESGGEFGRYVRVAPVVSFISQETGMDRKLVESWLVELPNIFVGKVALSLVKGEEGIDSPKGRFTRIYLSGRLVGF